jgi:hypothetical protein
LITDIGERTEPFSDGERPACEQQCDRCADEDDADGVPKMVKVIDGVFSVAGAQGRQATGALRRVLPVQCQRDAAYALALGLGDIGGSS